MVQMNNASHDKWLWRYNSEGDFLWKRVVEVRWGAGSVGDDSRGAVRPHGRSLWKKIVMGRQNFLNCTRW